jgi:branched-chain amino acid transport system ATP-binding protein
MTENPTSVTKTQPDRGGDTIIETEGLTKQFGGLVAVDDVNYRLPEGELRCLIGPNGAGKSTFFKLLTGQLAPTEGTIRYNGEDITGLMPHERADRGLSLKFQELSLFSGLTVEDNLRISVQRVTTEGTEMWRRVDDLLETIGLEDRRHAVVSDLSHGQQQWTEIAMSIGIDPKLLLLDEPTAGMTIDETEQTGDLIQDLNDQGLTIIVVEHDIKFVRQIAEWVTVFHNGALFREGTVEDIENDEGVKRIYLGKEASEPSPPHTGGDSR